MDTRCVQVTVQGQHCDAIGDGESSHHGDSLHGAQILMLQKVAEELMDGIDVMATQEFGRLYCLNKRDVGTFPLSPQPKLIFSTSANEAPEARTTPTYLYHNSNFLDGEPQNHILP